MQDYGTVISTLDGPCTRKFSFVIKKDSLVRRGQFVQLKTEEGKLIGRVSDIFKTNKYFTRPDSVKEYESSGKTLNEIFPTDNWEYLVAEIVPLGIFSDGAGFSDVSLPPSPGTKVTEPEKHILVEFFGLDPEGLNIGTLPYHGLEAKINPTRLLQKHLAVLAISGAGKSYLTSILIEELLNRTEEQGKIGVVVIDTHGEYVSFADDPKYSNKVRVFPASEIKIGLPNLSPNQIVEFVPKLSHIQARELAKIIRNLKKDLKDYSLKDLIEKIEKQTKSSTRDVLIPILNELEMMDVFDSQDAPNVNELCQQGRLSIIDLSDLVSTDKKQIIVAHITKNLFNARRSGSIPPFLIIIEEAHQFAPEKAKAEKAISKGIIQTIAREGRKFHASLCLVSQRPIQLSTTALSQCNTHIILRVTNPYDIDHIGKSSEGLTRDVLNQISSLRVGTGLIVGEAVNYPLFVKIRKRLSKESEKGMPLERAAREFSQRSKQKSKDAESFM